MHNVDRTQHQKEGRVSVSICEKLTEFLYMASALASIGEKEMFSHNTDHKQHYFFSALSEMIHQALELDETLLTLLYSTENIIE